MKHLKWLLYPICLFIDYLNYFSHLESFRHYNGPYQRYDFSKDLTVRYFEKTNS
jgi:hypothetical protein